MTEYTRRFLDFHIQNPHVYAAFERFARQAIASGRKRLGAGLIYERMRWHYSIETKGDEFQLNNNYRADYARMFEERNPEYKGFFSTRERKTHDLVNMIPKSHVFANMQEQLKLEIRRK
jgi:hypothetical protein